MRICVAPSVWRDQKVEHVACLVELLRRPEVAQYVPFQGDALVERARSRAATHFLEKTDADVLLTIDSDIVFRVEDALTVCEQAVEHGIVSAIYATRSASSPQTASFLGLEEVFFTNDPTPVPIRWAAAGFMAIHRRVVEALAKRPDMAKCHANFPWGFHPFYLAMVVDEPGLGRILLGEDYSFCERAREEGFQTYINPACRLGHIGDYTYRLEDMLRTPTPTQAMKIQRIGDETAWEYRVSALEPELRAEDWLGGTEPWVSNLVASTARALDAKTYVEIGVLAGRTIAEVLRLNPEIKALAVDIEPIPLRDSRLETLTGDSKETLWETDWKPDLVYVDGGHDYETAANDIRWAQERGAKVIIVHDIYSFPEVGQAVREQSRDGWRAVEIPVRQFPWYPQTGVAILTPVGGTDGA